MNPLRILTLNIGAASRSRADGIADWLMSRNDDAILLTETSSGPGTKHILNTFNRAGFAVHHARFNNNDRGVALVSRLQAETSVPGLDRVFIPGRVVGAIFKTQPPIAIVGIYVPSRDRDGFRIVRKARFIESFVNSIRGLPASLRAQLVIGGDYNVDSLGTPDQRYWAALPFETALLTELERCGLQNAYSPFPYTRTEHSWIDNSGRGYRLDHFYVGYDVLRRLDSCTYLHEPRERRLTDHSAALLCVNHDRIIRFG